MDLSRGLDVPLTPELLEELADGVVVGDGESDLVPLVLPLLLHVGDLPEDDLWERERDWLCFAREPSL